MAALVIVSSNKNNVTHACDKRRDKSEFIYILLYFTEKSEDFINIFILPCLRDIINTTYFENKISNASRKSNKEQGHQLL